MSVKIHPIPLRGDWDEGYALDRHVISSVMIGYNEYDHPVFDNEYSDIAGLLRDFKYHNKHDVLPEIVEAVLSLLNLHPEMKDVKAVIPVPPTKKRYNYQPTFEIAKAVAAELETWYGEDVLENTSAVESKNLFGNERSQLADSIVKKRKANRKQNVLIIDDVYRSGNTLNQCARVLRADPYVEKIFVLAITKTKNG